MFKRITIKEQLRTDRQETYEKQGIQNEDINNVGMTSAFMLEDNAETGETVAMLLLEIKKIKERINILEGGKR